MYRHWIAFRISAMQGACTVVTSTSTVLTSTSTSTVVTSTSTSTLSMSTSTSTSTRNLRVLEICTRVVLEYEYEYRVLHLWFLVIDLTEVYAYYITRINVNHEFTIAMITVIFDNCHDFVSRPWLSPKYVQFRLLNGQFCVNICSAFLFWAHIVAWLTLLPCRECIYGTMASCSARLHSSFLDQTDSDTASDTGACDHKHAAIASHIASRREKRPHLSASQ